MTNILKWVMAVPVLIALAGCLSSGMWWIRDVNGYGGRIADLEHDNANNKTAVAVMADDVHDTKEQVHDIWQYLHLDRKK